MPVLDVLDWNLETILPYLQSATSNLSICKIWRKTKVSKFGTRNAWKHTKVLKLEFENRIPIFEINTLEFVYLKNLAKKKKKNPRKFGIKNVLFVYFSARIWKMLLSYLKWASSSLAFSKIGPKTLDFWYFWVGIWRLFCYIWNQSPRNCLIAKFGTKNEKPKYGTKNALFGLFWPKIRYFGLFWEVLWKFFSHIWNQHPQICLFAKFHEKNGNAWIWTRNAWFGCFWTAI